MKKILLILCLFISLLTTAQSGEILSVSPNTGNTGQRLQVTITGEDTFFLQVSSTEYVSFVNQMQQQFIVNALDRVSNTVLVADVTIPDAAAIGPFDLYIDTNIWGIYNFLEDAFTVTNHYNTVKGNVGFDLNGNGCDVSDVHTSGIKVKLNDGTSDSFAFTNNAGDYIFYVPAGDYVITPEPERPHYGSSPTSATASFGTTNDLSETRNFCLVPNGVYNDLEVTLLPIGAARPGFDAAYRLVYKNNGNQTASGTVNFVFDDARMDFVSANPTLSSQTVNNLSWNYTNLLPFESRTIIITVNINSPMELPPVNNGNSLSFSASVNPVSGDQTPNDNTANFNQIALGSYDPNDKTVIEGSEIHISEAGNYLNYLIRFQNSGTFAAENVVVKDVLASNLDKSTLKIVSASHQYRSSLSAGGKLEFFFDNINLPTEADDEPGSHGFIAFKIKPSSAVGIGSTIENTAEIFFDFNFPIVTNTVSTTFSLLANHNFDFEDGFSLYPNPVDSVLNIKMQSSFETATVKIFNQLGQLVKTVNNIRENQKNSIEVGDLKSGSYVVQITTNKGTSTKKLIKY